MASSAVLWNHGDLGTGRRQDPAPTARGGLDDPEGCAWEHGGDAQDEQSQNEDECGNQSLNWEAQPKRAVQDYEDTVARHY